MQISVTKVPFAGAVPVNTPEHIPRGDHRAAGSPSSGRGDFDAAYTSLTADMRQILGPESDAELCPKEDTADFQSIASPAAEEPDLKSDEVDHEAIVAESQTSGIEEGRSHRGTPLPQPDLATEIIGKTVGEGPEVGTPPILQGTSPDMPDEAAFDQIARGELSAIMQPNVRSASDGTMATSPAAIASHASDMPSRLVASSLAENQQLAARNAPLPASRSAAPDHSTIVAAAVLAPSDGQPDKAINLPNVGHIPTLAQKSADGSEKSHLPPATANLEMVSETNPSKVWQKPSAQMQAPSLETIFDADGRLSFAVKGPSGDNNIKDPIDISNPPDRSSKQWNAAQYPSFPVTGVAPMQARPEGELSSPAATLGLPLHSEAERPHPFSEMVSASPHLGSTDAFRNNLIIAPGGNNPLPRHVARHLIDAAQQNPSRTLDITLNPEELGRVRLSMSTSDSGMVVNVISERPETLDLLRRHIDQLGQDFRSLGYKNVTFAFAHRDQDHSGNTKHHPPDDPEAQHRQTGALGTEIVEIQLKDAQTSGLDLRL